MDTQDRTSAQDKQVTIEVPEDRLADFYAFYSRFLAIGSGRRSRGGQRHGGHDRRARHAEHRCGHRDEAGENVRGASVGSQATSPPAATEPGIEPVA